MFYISQICDFKVSLTNLNINPVPMKLMPPKITAAPCNPISDSTIIEKMKEIAMVVVQLTIVQMPEPLSGRISEL